MLNKPLLVVAGPTASGKTALAVQLAKRLNGEVVSADSMQVYSGIPIATACPSEEEKEGIPHHLQECVGLEESFSVARYAEKAREIIADIHQRGHLPILCGGTGLYIRAITDNVLYEKQDDARAAAVRERLKQEHAVCGDQGMWDKLAAVDDELAQKLHIHDRGRVMRALEVFELTDVPMSEQQRRQKEQPSPYQTAMLLLDCHDRAWLYDRINRRVDIMVQNGLLEETAAVLRMDSPTAQQAIGCKELRPYFDGDCTLQEALECMKRRSRQYAKRQLSWFHRIDVARPVYVDTYTSVEELVAAAINLIEQEWKGAVTE